MHKLFCETTHSLVKITNNSAQSFAYVELYWYATCQFVEKHALIYLFIPHVCFFYRKQKMK